MTRSTRSAMRRRKTAGIHSTTIAIAAHRARRAGTTPIVITPEQPTLTTTVHGPKFLITAACGFRTKIRAGLLTAPAAGFTNRIGDGRGLVVSLGAGRRITPGARSFMAAAGHGGRDRFTAP